MRRPDDAAVRREAEGLARSIADSDLSQWIVLTAAMIGRLEEALAAETLPSHGTPPASREAMREALARARVLLALLRARAS